jgi:hypothetical protein
VHWQIKYPLAVWFGSTTGDDYLWKNDIKRTRYEIVRLSKRHPEYIKAWFTNLV